MYRWFGVVPQGFCCLSRFTFLVILRAFSWDFGGGVLEPFLCGIWCGSHTWGPCASFLGDLAPPNPWKALRFGGFRWSSSSWGLVMIFAIPHDWECFSAITLRERSSLRWPRHPQSFSAIRWVNREIGWCKVEGWPAVAVFPVLSGEGGITTWGRPNRPGLIGRKFWFWPRSSGSILALTRGLYGWNLWAFRVRLLGFSLRSLCSREGGLTAPGTRSNRPRPFLRKFDFAGSFSRSLFAWSEERSCEILARFSAVC
jgi:hypothetical protein